MRSMKSATQTIRTQSDDAPEASAGAVPDAVLPRKADEHMTGAVTNIARNLRRRAAPAAQPPELGEPPLTLIHATSGWARLRLGELWEFRELVFFFIWRDVKVRYKQTVLGAAWAIIQPLFTMAIFSIFFGRLANVPSDGLPYPLFALAGLVPWLFFMNGLSHGANSLVENEKLIKKVFFPRMIVPVSSVLAGLVDFAVASSLLVLAMAYYGVLPGAQIALLPFFVLLGAVAAMGVALWLSALNVQFRDVRYVVPFLGQVWMFATPIAYPTSLLNPSWQLVYAMNPMVGVVDGIRWSLLGTGGPEWGVYAVSTAVAVTMLVTGAFFFRRVERSFADIA
jgi:lipopolysaccharide transport system permease protein